ncbi:MAG: tetratricopeptide repeat protein [Arcobacteraceae bacterium]
MNRIIFGISCFVVSASLAETSMFGAGNLNSANPYGLSQAEEVIVKNKKIVAKNEQKIKKTTSEIQELNERVGGVESLLEGESLKLNKTFISLNKHIDDYKLHTEISKNNINKNSDKIVTIERQIDTDLENMKSLINQNTKNMKTLQKSFDKITHLVNDINSKYVTKKEFDKLISLLDKKLVQPKSTPKKCTQSKKIDSSKSSAVLLDEAKVFFKKDYFTNALPIFEDLISRNYKPAESNFYVGEIKYYRKKYKDALHYFKTSMTLYDKASYLPKLLLHSAISFEELGDNENAQNFYNTIIDIYPESNEAKEASKKITI